MPTVTIPESSPSPSTAAVVSSAPASTDGSNSVKKKKKRDEDDVDEHQQPKESACSCLGNSNKRPKTDKGNNKKEEETISLPLTLQDPRIWKALAVSGYLNCKDMGRLLLLTWKNSGEEEEAAPVGGSGGGDSNVWIWKLLCQSYWGREGANSLLEVSGIHPKDYFHMFAYPAKHKTITLPPLPPPQFTPKDYALIVEIRTEDDQLLFTKAVDGSTIPEFFISGKTSKIYLDKPLLDIYKVNSGHGITYKDHDDFYNSLSRMFWPEKQISLNWKGTAHLIRKPDGKILPLVDMVDIREYIESRPCGVTLRGLTEGYNDDDEYNQDQRDRGYLLTNVCSRANDYQQPFASGCRNILMQEHLGIQQINEDDQDFYDGLGCMEPRIELEYKLKLSESGVAWLGIHAFYIKVLLWHDGCGEPVSEQLTKKGLQYAQVLEALSDWQIAPKVNNIG